MNLLELGVFPLLVSLFILWPTLRDPAVLPVENNDESAHTLVEIPLALNALLHGELPKINLFNNFGTPLLGDPIVCPLAPHAVTYLLFDPVTAYVIDKVLISVLTVIVLILFYRRFFPTWVAPLCAALTFSTPGFLWFVHHFPHQGVVLYFTAILLSFERFRRDPSVRSLALTFLCQLAFFLGVGINAVLFAIPFLVAYAVLAERTPGLRLASFLASMAAAVGFVHAHLLAFWDIAAATGRSRVNFAELAGYTHGSFVGYFLGFKETYYRNHTDAAIFYSLPVVCVALIGLHHLVRTKHPSWPPVLWLGFAPFLFVCLVLVFPVLRDWITPLRPVDVTRIWWFSNLFFMIAFGYGVTALLEHVVPRVAASWMLLASLAVLAVAGARIRGGTMDVWLSLVATALIFGLSLLDAQRRWTVPMVLLVLCSLLPRADRFVELINPPWALARREDLRFPAAFARRMTPYTRLASTSTNLDQEAARDRLLGSNGRSIILSAELKDHLAANGLIEASYGGLLYHFRPAAPGVMAEYGIRYFVTRPDDALERWGWRRLGEDSPPYRLYESPLSVHPCAARDARGDVLEYLPITALGTTSFSIEIDRRHGGHEVVCAFYAWPGWRATQSGGALAVGKSSHAFLRVTPTTAGRLSFDYAPISDRYLLLSSVLSLGVSGLWLVGFRIYRVRRPDAFVRRR